MFNARDRTKRPRTCVVAFMGAEDVLSIEDPRECEIAEKGVCHMYVERNG